ncbi:hypothetical protein ACTXT7_002659 [Hymenolepis weldensis]
MSTLITVFAFLLPDSSYSSSIFILSSGCTLRRRLYVSFLKNVYMYSQPYGKQFSGTRLVLTIQKCHYQSISLKDSNKGQDL